jgi:hypothetical protein
MKKLIPIPKIVTEDICKTKKFRHINFVEETESNRTDLKEILGNKFWNYKDVEIHLNCNEELDCYRVILNISEKCHEAVVNEELFKKQGYVLNVLPDHCEICYMNEDGLINAISTFKQLMIKNEDVYCLDCCKIVDWPIIEQRSISNTFSWYAGYGRLGFDSQLWGYDEWVEYLNICSDLKINQLNLCMYGYWPFEFKEYPETVLRDFKMQIWNNESKNWITIEYMHPNIADEFLSRLIDYGHKLGITFFAYVGLNSYNGGYSSVHKDKRMKLPKNSKYVNDFDRLCLSDIDSINYLKSSFRKITQLGFDGIDFEESEEAFWYCDCDKCKENFLKDSNTPEEAKHIANSELFNTLYKVIREENPNCKIGIRAWRQPPLEKPKDILKEMVESIPKDVGLFWAPGLYVPESEFEKWVNAFGKDRIWARDTESNGVASCFGRLIRNFRINGLRCAEETNDQFLEEDIKQHIGSQKLGVKGINGYLFEWYGFFMHLFAPAYYGWGAYVEAEDFYIDSLEAVFGEELAGDILYVLENMFTIHESQLNIFPTEFPFARNKVEKKDLPRIHEAIEKSKTIISKLKKVKSTVAADERIKAYEPHFTKLILANKRNRIIYDLAIASVNYDNAKSKQEKRKYLLEMYELNEKNFDVIKKNYFDVMPVSETGTKSCMIPCHELKRVLTNELYPEKRNDEPIYLGVEALGWLWL